MNCSICAGDNIKKLFTKDKFSFRMCKRCGLIFISPQPTEAEIEAIYSEDYYRPWMLDGQGRDSGQYNKVLTFNRWIGEIEKYKRAGEILDVGCATGFFLEVASRRGWRPSGVEISKYSSEIARKKFGQRIFTGTLDKAGFDSGRFDVVTAFDLIEHLFTPTDFFREVFRILKPGGIVTICTANTGSLSYRLMRKNWPHFKIEHLHYFHPKNISTVLKEEGFEILEIRKAKKILTINYISSILNSYRVPVVSRAAGLLNTALPRALTRRPLLIPSGEMLVLARRT